MFFNTITTSARAVSAAPIGFSFKQIARSFLEPLILFDDELFWKEKRFLF